jgi:hypothetical protein
MAIKKDQKIDNSPIDYSKISFKTNISELSQFNLELQTKQGLGEIHENYCSQIFSNLNYVIRQEKVGTKDKYIYTDIRELENYGIFVAKSTDEIVVANDMIRFMELANIQYNNELLKYDQFVSTAKGGVKRNNRFYKKTKKNTSKRNTNKRNKHTTRTLQKRKTRKIKKTNSRRKLRTNKKY